MAQSLKGKRLITAGDMTGDLTSIVANLDTIIAYEILAIWTGTPTGDIIQEVQYEESGSWIQVDTVAVTAAGQNIWTVLDPAHFQVRIFWDFTAGAGTVLDVYFVGRTSRGQVAAINDV